MTDHAEVLVVGALEKDKTSANYGEFDARLERTRRYQIAGGVVLGVGVGVLAGGIVRWAVLASREKKNGGAKHGAFAPMFGRATAGVVFTRRF